MVVKFRIGAHHRTTIIRYLTEETPDDQGRRPSDRLWALAQDAEKAEIMVRLLNTGTDRP
jgi:hypothetical protein